VFQRAFGQSIRTPTWLVVMLFQPLLFLYLFGPLLKNSLRGVDTSEVFNLYIPGLMVQLALYRHAVRLLHSPPPRCASA